MYKLEQLECPRYVPETPAELMARRASYLEHGYEEYEGCWYCFSDAGYDVSTMAWRIVPLRKCGKHMKNWVRVGLVKREQNK